MYSPDCLFHLMLFCRLGQVLVYKKIRQAIGIKNTVVSGGGSLASHLDDFFELLGLQVVNGWGLSEVMTCAKHLLTCNQVLQNPKRKTQAFG